MAIGTDLLSTWSFNSTGDIETVNSTENVEQAIVNRLTCSLGSLQLYYNDYGSILYSFLGWKRNNATLEFIRLELINRLNQDNRLNVLDCQAEYDTDGSVNVSLRLKIVDSVETVNLSITNDGVIIK